MKIKIADYLRKDGNLMAVDLKLQEPKEIHIFKQFLETEPHAQKCPHCHKSNVIGDDDMVIRIDSPLADRMGMNLAAPIITCSECNKRIEVSMVDFTAFPSVVAFLNQLKLKYLQQKASGANG